MNFRSQAIRWSCFLILLALIGCTTFHRDSFLAEHSLDRFLTDRPKSAALLSEHLGLQQWLREQWSRPIGEYRIFWSDEQPTVSMAEHGFMPHSKLIVMRISDELTAADQLTALCFEICNAQAFSDIDEVAAQAMKDRPVVYLYHRNWLWAYNSKLTGVGEVPDGLLRLEGLKLN